MTMKTVLVLGGGTGGIVATRALRRRLAPGDRVVLGWKTACGSCVYCLRGAPRLCRKPPSAGPRLHRADGTVLTPVLRTGTFVTHTVVTAVAAVKIPQELPMEQACRIG